MRQEIHWPTAFALRLFRVPVGLACLWWLITRNFLEFEVTPKGAADNRQRGRTPRVLLVMIVLVTAMILYAAAGLAGLVPWQTSAGSTVASGAWLVVADIVLVLGTRRIRAAEFATSRSNAHRIGISAPVSIAGTGGELLDVSAGGEAVRFPRGVLPASGPVMLRLPGAELLRLDVIRRTAQPDGSQTASLRTADKDWDACRALSLRIFHTPDGVLAGFPAGVPAAASLRIGEKISGSGRLAPQPVPGGVQAPLGHANPDPVSVPAVSPAESDAATARAQPQLDQGADTAFKIRVPGF